MGKHWEHNENTKTQKQIKHTLHLSMGSRIPQMGYGIFIGKASIVHLIEYIWSLNPKLWSLDVFTIHFIWYINSNNLWFKIIWRYQCITPTSCAQDQQVIIFTHGSTFCWFVCTWPTSYLLVISCSIQ
jgi:hypothetical protein